MKTSISIDLVWQLAGQEAIASDFKEILPEHFLVSLLKYVELPAAEVEKIALGAEASRALLGEVNELRGELAERGIDSTQTRRGLRARLGKGNCPYDGGQKHRSQASRDAFDAAVRLAENAGSEMLSTVHILRALLTAPTPAMVEVLGNVARPAMPKVAVTPLLDAYGRNLCEFALKSSQEQSQGRVAESRALVRALCDRSRRGVVLIAEDEDEAFSVAVGAAGVMSSKSCPSELKAMQVLDVRSIRSSVPGDEIGHAELLSETLDRVERMFAEAITVGNVVLFCPSMPEPIGNADTTLFNVLKSALAKREPQCICRVSPEVYQKYLKADRAWRQITHVMWIHEQKLRELPDEL